MKHQALLVIAALLALGTVGLGCTNENHPPRTAAAATGLMADVMSDEGDCERSDLLSDGVVHFNFTFRRQRSILGFLTLFLGADAPRGPNQAVAVPVSGLLFPEDVDECEHPVHGVIRFEHGPFAPPPEGAISDVPHVPTIIHSLYLPAQPLINDPLTCDGATVGEVPESRMIDARFFCKDFVQYFSPKVDGEVGP